MIQGDLSRIEKGDRTINKKLTMRIAKALNVD
jgi:hypothetical protein